MSSSNTDHAAYGTLLRIIELQLDPAFTLPAIAENEQFRFARDKVAAMSAVLKVLLEQTPAELCSTSGLLQLQNNLNSPLNELTSFVGNGNGGHLVNAASQFEGNIMPLQWGYGPHLSNLPSNLIGPLFEIQAEATQKTINQLAAQRDEFALKVQELTAKVAEQTTQITASIEAVTRAKTDAAATVAQLDVQFAENEKARIEAANAAIAKLTEDIGEFNKNTRSEASNLISTLTTHKEEARKLVQIVGNDTVTGNYQRIAVSEGKTADILRLATLAFFGLGLIVAGATFYKFWGQPFNAENGWAVVIRLLYAVAITTPAWYTARESARHRSNSDRARQTELDLAAIGPFIELLPEEKKIEIREKMTGLYFGKSVETHTVNSPFDAIAVKDMAVELVKLLKK
ncbi:hypothetical protein ABL840_30280 [Variovorax sp. NFACC27]|uniref:hypothetical protein n=1 Tax=unclassified Variovorax TaxID=663243 RepID=UPI00089643BA|nr:hypothetical protein SAMN03159371_02640 [Variovorax sp. NFACC28]SEG60334.1 hypothetical protein SAMN03159365_02720 [Variovorax sp. NFACC29]SFC59845.1 hypothetical protein SAMN03159379_02611 [Variovorax sp. NFACC26]SFG67278.1 hypothetical protein SAMN03159447_04359 [Variovorax sp. NFACC27]